MCSPQCAHMGPLQVPKRNSSLKNTKEGKGGLLLPLPVEVGTSSLGSILWIYSSQPWLRGGPSDLLSCNVLLMFLVPDTSEKKDEQTKLRGTGL